MMTFTVQQDEDAYFPIIKNYLIVLLADLNESLKGSRISKKDRRSICETFLFSHCEKLDQEWFRCEGQTHYPLIAFSKHFVEFVIPRTDDITILIGDKGNELHAIASCLVEEFFDALRERIPHNTTGQIGDELQDEEMESVPEPKLSGPCDVCKGTAQCYCLRKGSEGSQNCPRCNGTGKCQHCHGTGLSGQ